MTNTTENIRAWLRSCPAFSSFDSFGVDFMGKDPTAYALYSNPSPIKYSKDILGDIRLDDVQELNYSFISLFPFSKNISQNLDNLDFYNNVIAWIIEKNQRKEFPEIAEGKVISLMPTLTPYVMDADSDSGRYQIQLKVRYRVK